MRLPALAALTAAALTMGTVAVAQTSGNDRASDTGSISAEELSTQLSPTPPRPPLARDGAVRPSAASATVPIKRKLTLRTMPWLTGAYN